MNSESEMMLQYEIESVTNMMIMSDRMTIEMMMSDDVCQKVPTSNGRRALALREGMMST